MQLGLTHRLGVGLQLDAKLQSGLVLRQLHRDQRREQTQENDSSDEGGTGQWFNDVWIETKIKGQLLVASEVTSVNFFWRFVLNDVYVIARAKTNNERSKVLKIIQETEGVRSVTHHIEVR